MLFRTPSTCSFTRAECLVPAIHCSAGEHDLSWYTMVDAMFPRPNLFSMPGIWPEVLGLCILNGDLLWIQSENMSMADHISISCNLIYCFSYQHLHDILQQVTGPRLHSFGLLFCLALSLSFSDFLVVIPYLILLLTSSIHAFLQDLRTALCSRSTCCSQHT